MSFVSGLEGGEIGERIDVGIVGRRRGSIPGIQKKGRKGKKHLLAKLGVVV